MYVFKDIKGIRTYMLKNIDVCVLEYMLGYAYTVVFVTIVTDIIVL